MVDYPQSWIIATCFYYGSTREANWRHVFDLTRFRERPTKLDSTQYRQRVQKALFAKVRVFYDHT